MHTDSTVDIGLVLPDLLGTYGDVGNATVLHKRLVWRGFAARVVPVAFGEPVPDSCDVYVIGGGEDSAQTLAVRHLRAHPGLQRAAARGAVILGVCAGLQILGESFTGADTVEHAGLGLLDLTSTPGGRRAIGEVLVQPDAVLAGAGEAPLAGLGEAAITGFENHQGRTRLGPSARPLGRVLAGTGNGDGTEGAVQGRIIATYLHGPVLPRNPHLADLLIEWVVGERPGPLELTVVGQLRDERLRACQRAASGSGQRASGASAARPQRGVSS
ncbi:type 1 glutamine amidotransferase [Goodfellowiella coeruleoviolacea]|uniref:Lipid II isoglutaminyl synthase (glutamine-hydrolyzing) subunit GatD n=1 Tax=Goodfellowiella coeruleoviolacea TaxID=334858 RepID=A0AAE3GB06_9PSEU|nr:glutamine amidotransferase [Goodfellowiella coeruleoviolacea]MCP2164941.1 hypothetical protein [Goodfellowiella coeruleoviolacea]